MARPVFSVVIDNYNYGRFIGQALDSVLAQDAPAGSVETIVVDDGSTDDSREVVARYGDKVRLIAQKNGGQSAAFATGFAAATGEFVCPLDSDDYWTPDKLTSVAAAFADPRIGIVQHYQRDVDAVGRPLNNPLPPWPQRYTIGDFLDGRFVNAATSSLAFRKSVLDKLLPVPKDVFYLYDDYLLDHGLLECDVACIPRILGFHRIHGANNWAMNMRNPKKLGGSIDELRRFRAYLEPKLKARGLAFTARYETLQRLEILRREVLLAAHEGRRGDAFASWRRLNAEMGSGLGAFRAATLLLAIASPSSYLRLHALYSDQHWMADLRRRLLPEPAGH
ncbi:MAG: glycosyltransferase [Elusimicrobiota bacterium]|nr:glycosyltransferase [Elusimicrobiota bacterium]